MSQPTCNACGQALPDSGVFCPHCGALRPPSAPTPVKEAPPPTGAHPATNLDDNAYAAGDVVLDYRLERELGAGGMGSVWLAHHQVSEQPVAIKILPAGLARDREVRERFLQEAKALAKLDHPNIVPLVTFSSRGDEHFLVMKFVDGASVHTLVEREKRLSFEETRTITRHVLNALGYAHGEGVIHRDIKPGNVLVAKDGRTFLADFGIAKQESGAKLTQTGMLMGTPQYMAPEQISGQAVTPRTDLYAVGLLVYEMLTGDPPFDFGKTFAILKAHLESKVPHPERRRGETIPPDLLGLMRSLLQKDPDKRAASAADAIAILEDPSSVQELPSPFDEFEEFTVPPTEAGEREFFEKSAAASAPVAAPEPAVQKRETATPVTQGTHHSGPLPTMAARGPRWPLALAALLALVAVGGLLSGGYYLTRPEPPPPPPPEAPEVVTAKEHIVYGRYSQAVDALKPLVSAGDPEAVLLLARAELGRGDPTAAAAALKKMPGALDDDQRGRHQALAAQVEAKLKAAAQKPPPKDDPPPDAKKDDDDDDDKKSTRRRRRRRPDPKPEVFDDLSDAQLREGVGATDVAVRNCFQEHLSEDEKKAPAEVRFQVQLESSGAVRSARFIRKTAGGAGLARCLSRVARGWKFPAFNAEKIIFDHTFAYRPPS